MMILFYTILLVIAVLIVMWLDKKDDFEYYPEHNDRYLKQCYYNLQEKADRGIITKEEWKLIHKNIYVLIEGEI